MEIQKLPEGWKKHSVDVIYTKEDDLILSVVESDDCEEVIVNIATGRAFMWNEELSSQCKLVFQTGDSIVLTMISQDEFFQVIGG